MRERKIFFWPKSRQDVIESRRYIARDNLEAAEAFHSAFESACTMLLDLPEMGSVRSFGKLELDDLRMLPVPKFKNYLIFYRSTSEGLEIVRVLHGARDLPTLFE